jgi:hypothetical protein
MSRTRNCSSTDMSQALSIEGADRRPSFAGWKFDLLDAMCMDPRMPRSTFPVAYRILQAVNMETGIAFISDAVLADELPNVDPRGLNRHRKAMEASGYVAIKRGGRGRATQYKFLDDNINAMLDRRVLLRETRKAARDHPAKELSRSARPTSRAASKEKVRRDEMVVKSPPLSTRQGGEGNSVRLVNSPPLHLTPTPQNYLYQGNEGVEPDFETTEPSLNPTEAPSWSDVDERAARFDEIAGFLEFDCDSSRGEAERRAAAIVAEEGQRS